MLVFLAGIGFVAAAAHRIAPALAAGPIAGLVAYGAHAPLDWDWEMPALTLFALILAGAVIAAVERPALGPRAIADSGGESAGPDLVLGPAGTSGSSRA